jgi:hypothetical protein
MFFPDISRLLVDVYTTISQEASFGKPGEAMKPPIDYLKCPVILIIHPAIAISFKSLECIKLK